MILLARPSAATTTWEGNPRLGLLMTPRGLLRPGQIASGVRYAADNDAYAGFHEGRFLRMLDALGGLPHPPLWVSCPDVVGDAAATAALFDLWEPRIRGLGLPVAFVTQDGLDPPAVPWPRLDAVFLGGSDGHKFGPVARAVAAEARRRGVWVHAGRCQTLVKIRVMADWGVDSIDGTCTAVKPNFWVPKLVEWMAKAERETRHPTIPGMT